MAGSLASSKRLQIDKANATMVIAISIASFLAVFSMIAVKSLWSQRGYQAKVIAKKETARNQLKQNIDTANTLKTSYQAFVGTPANIIGGNSTGKGDRDGDNAKIILDALPSSYDFPALATSLEKLLSQKSLKINSIVGTDNEATQQAVQSSPTPTSIPMPFQIGVTGDYKTIQSLITTFERSIRPFQIQTFNFQGTDKALTISITAQTFFQPEVSLKLGSETVK